MRHVILASLLLAGPVTAAAHPRVDELTEKANALLAEGQHEQAAAALTDAVQVAAGAGDRDAQIEASFALARANEEWAAADPERRDDHLRTALAWYVRLWTEEPRRADAEAAARNNSAQILAGFGEKDRAAEHFQAAIAIDDPMQPFYLANYASFLASSGKSEQAISLYERALAKTPEDVVTEAKLLRLYSGPKVADHLWRLVGGDELARAQGLALEHLPRNLDADVKRDLLAVVAITLARQHVTWNDFADSPVHARLAQLGEDPPLRDGIRELDRLYQRRSLDPQSYSWWRQSLDRRLPAVAPPLAFSALVSELGNQISASAPEQAERYYTLAIDVSRGHDPEPFIALADLYSRNGQTEKLEQLDSRYHNQILEMKGAALRTGDWRSVYRFHVALGTIYARLDTGADPSKARPVIFYLERAIDSARELSKATNTSVVLDARSADLLARSYARAEPNSGKDRKLRFDLAEEYLKTGRKTSAQLVLQPAAEDSQEMGVQEKIRFEQLQRDIARQPEDVLGYGPSVDRSKLWLQVPEGVSLDAPTTDAIEKLLEKYATAPGERTEAEKKLKQQGVTDIRLEPSGAGWVTMRRNSASVTMKVAPRETMRVIEPRAAGKTVVLRVPAGVRLEDRTVRELEKLLADYYAAEGPLRQDMATKLGGFGVTKINEAVENRGSVVLRVGEKSVTIPFEIASR